MADICLYSSLVPPPRTPAGRHILRPAEANSDAACSSSQCLRCLTRSVGGRLVHSCLLSPTCKMSAEYRDPGCMGKLFKHAGPHHAARRGPIHLPVRQPACYIQGRPYAPFQQQGLRHQSSHDLTTVWGSARLCQTEMQRLSHCQTGSTIAVELLELPLPMTHRHSAHATPECSFGADGKVGCSASIDSVLVTCCLHLAASYGPCALLGPFRMKDIQAVTNTLSWHTLSLNRQLARRCQSILCCLNAQIWRSEPHICSRCAQHADANE